MKTHLQNNMKKLFVLGMLAIMVIARPQHTFAQQKSVGINNASPDVSAALDVKSGALINQGILIPFVDLATAIFPSPGPANGLLVHNSNVAYGQGTGIYQNIGTATAPIWLKQLTRNDAWYLYGNRITSAGTPGTYGTSKIPSGNWIGTANATDLTFGTDSTERARLFSTGEFSIGSSSSGAKVDIHQTTSTPTLRLYNYGNANEMEFRRSSGTQSAQTATGAGSIVGRILGVGYDGSGYNNRTIAGISFETETATSSTNSSGRIVFTTTTTGSTSGTGGTERMRIDNAGNIGINQTNPAEKLDVVGNIKLSTTTPNATTANGQVQFTAGGINTTTKMVVVRKTISVTTSNTTPSANVFDDGYMRFGVYYNSTVSRWLLSMSPYNNQYYDHNYNGNAQYYNGTYYYTSDALFNYQWGLSDDVNTTSGTYYEIAGVRNTAGYNYAAGGSGMVYAEGTTTTNPFYEFSFFVSYTSTSTQRLITVVIKAYY